MRILIDECVDERIRHSFTDHDCQTVRYAGFAGLKNGELLNAAESGKFDTLVTVDQGLPYEQNLKNRKIAIILLKAKSNRLADLLALVPECLAVLSSIKPAQIVGISGSPNIAK